MRDPFDHFHSWYQRAWVSEPRDPNAMALATVDAHGRPSLRMVLLKGVDSPEHERERGFVFYTNLESRKAVELIAHPVAAACFYWKSLQRQLRIEGPVRQVKSAEADHYFASRPRGSQIGAWASQQSRSLASRSTLIGQVKAVEACYASQSVPRPDFWSGFRILPLVIEFWLERNFRLHDRIVYHRPSLSASWTSERLYP